MVNALLASLASPARLVGIRKEDKVGKASRLNAKIPKEGMIGMS